MAWQREKNAESFGRFLNSNCVRVAYGFLDSSQMIAGRWERVESSRWGRLACLEGGAWQNQSLSDWGREPSVCKPSPSSDVKTLGPTRCITPTAPRCLGSHVPKAFHLFKTKDKVTYYYDWGSLYFLPRAAAASLVQCLLICSCLRHRHRVVIDKHAALAKLGRTPKLLAYCLSVINDLKQLAWRNGAF